MTLPLTLQLQCNWLTVQSICPSVAVHVLLPALFDMSCKCSHNCLLCMRSAEQGCDVCTVRRTSQPCSSLCTQRRQLQLLIQLTSNDNNTITASATGRQMLWTVSLLHCMCKVNRRQIRQVSVHGVATLWCKAIMICS